MRRAAVLAEIADRITAMRLTHPTRVAVDGVDAAGKTLMAGELADILRSKGRPVIRASIDGFHYPAAHRLAKGENSPEGYYLDSFNYPAIIGTFLEPLGPDGSGLYQEAVYDYRSDRPIDGPVLKADPTAAVLVDGVFLLRPELRSYWDFSVFVHVDFEVALRRAERRDLKYFDSVYALRRKYRSRYFPGQEIYFSAATPTKWASTVVDNNDLAGPFIVGSRQA